MFNKQERARREAAQEFHARGYDAAIRAEVNADNLDALNVTARLHRKQAELWEKHIKAFDDAALRTAKLVGRK